MTGSEIQAHLRTKLLGKKILVYDVLESTNLTAKEIASSGGGEEREEEDGTVVLAEEQTAGRGRFSRRWISERGKNLTFSVITKPEAPPESTGLLPIAAGLSVAQAVEEISGLRPECKWPNDVLLRGRKFCGILCEVVAGGKPRTPQVVVGMGINVNQAAFPPELEHAATSLLLATGGREFDRARLLAEVLNRLEPLLEMLSGGSGSRLEEAWAAYAPMLGKTVTVRDSHSSVSGRAAGLAPDGGLLLDTPDGEVKVLAGDVTIISH